MEASETPSPASQESPPPPPTPPAEEKPSGGWRALAVVLALALAFACAVLVIAMVEIGDTPTCDDVISGEAALPADGECFKESSTQKTISLIFGWPAAVLAGLAALAALYFAARARLGTLLLRLTAAAIILGGLSILIGSV